MKKFLALFISLVIAIAFIAGVTVRAINFQLFDTTWSFDYAYVKLPTGEIIEGEVDAWRDYSDGDQLQVMINGTTYLSNSTNIVLVSKGE